VLIVHLGTLFAHQVSVIIQPNKENQIQGKSSGLCKKEKRGMGKMGRKIKGLLAFRS
jgi:hypothetical protein